MTRIPACLFKGALQLVQLPNLKSSAGYQIPAPCVLKGSHAGAVNRSGQPLPATIPKILWTYWSQPHPDVFVCECLQSWRLQCPDYEVRLVHPGNLADYVQAGELPGQFAGLHPTKQSDWLRLYLVARHGGFWLDASSLLTSSMDWMQASDAATREFVGFYLEKFTRLPAFPVVESWAFGAPPGSRFMAAWQEEFHQALIEEGAEVYLRRLQQQPGWAALQQGIKDPCYLLIHIAAQRVLQRQEFSCMVLFKAEDTAYYYHHGLRWKWYLLYPRLCLSQAPAALAPVVKLRGGERRHFSEMLARHGGAVPGSIWHRALNP
ncbi:glycosyltransferase family 32 protein [Comamonas composti]|uniref:glycosyltransferase family 32 protein n=1 Tax=Comamonas composti TaxID=408558 RepID=UPI00047900E9|nr:capsular polysaccharide synthesis protein [Comamonas composti]